MIFVLYRFYRNIHSVIPMPLNEIRRHAMFPMGNEMEQPFSLESFAVAVKWYILGPSNICLKIVLFHVAKILLNFFTQIEKAHGPITGVPLDLVLPYPPLIISM